MQVIQERRSHASLAPTERLDNLPDRLQQINDRLEQLLKVEQNPALLEEFVKLFQEKRSLETTSRLPSPRQKRSPQVRQEDAPGEQNPSGSILGNINRELSRLEKRDWELWWIVSATGIFVATGFLITLLPAAFSRTENLHLEITVSRQLVVGLLVLLILLNVYLVSRRVELRRLQQRAISSTIQNELVRLQSFTDPLTEVYNRRSLEDMANRYISHAGRLKKPLTFLMADIDRFKEINTRFGHLRGDFVLAEVAGLLRHSVRGCDAVIRYGGDEFLTIVADASADEAENVVRRVQGYLSDWNKNSQLEDFTLTLSIGIAEWTEGKALDEILDTADRDMYAKKNRTRSPIVNLARAATATS